MIVKILYKNSCVVKISYSTAVGMRICTIIITIVNSTLTNNIINQTGSIIRSNTVVPSADAMYVYMRCDAIFRTVAQPSSSKEKGGSFEFHCCNWPGLLLASQIGIRCIA